MWLKLDAPIVAPGLSLKLSKASREAIHVFPVPESPTTTHLTLYTFSCFLLTLLFPKSITNYYNYRNNKKYLYKNEYRV